MSKEITPAGIISKDGDAMASDLSVKADRRVVLKLDLLLVPMCCAMYLLAFLDRSNIGNGRVAGLQADLKMTDIQYQTGNYHYSRIAATK